MSWRRRLGLVGLALMPDAVAALEGEVVDAESGAPLPNVTLSIVGRAQTVRADTQGRFILVPDPQPPFEVLAILPDGTYLKPIAIHALPAEGPLVVRIPPSVSESVAVTAGASPGIRVAPAAGTTVISGDDLRAREARSLTEALENVPGVGSVSEGHASVPAIRGLAQARSLVLIDGARVTTERRIGPSATFLDPFVLEAVEVARGPGSVAYGSDALGGVILARTRRPRLGGDLSFTVAGSAGAGVPQGRLGLEVESGLGDASGILLSAHHRDFGDYRSPRGEVGNSGSRDTGFLLGYGQMVRGGLLSIALQGDYGRDVERPRTDSEAVRFYYPTEDSSRFTAAYETGPRLRFDSTVLSLFVGKHAVVTDQDAFATATEPRSIARADVSAKDFGLRGEVTRHWGQTEVAFGIDLNGRFDLEAEDVAIVFDASGAPAASSSFTTIEDARRIDAGAYVSADRALFPAVTLGAGFRYDRVRSVNQGGFFGDRSVSHTAPSGYAGITLGPFSGFTASLQYARGFRDARLSDRFFRGVTGAGFITGNPALDPERSHQADLVLRWPMGRWRPALYAYHYRIDDLIERYEDPSDSDLFFFRNRGRARIRGVELELSVELPSQVTLRVSGTVSEGEAKDDGTPLDDIAPENLAVEARKELGPRGFVQVRGSWVDALEAPGPNEVALAGRALVDASAGWRAARRLEMQLVLRNLFGETYLLTPDRRSPLAPGRSGVLSARATF